MNDLSNSVPITKESTVVKNDKVIALRMLRINPFKTSREGKFMPINQDTASIRKNPITISQPHVITKINVNSNSNCLSFTGVDNTVKTKRPQPRSNTKNDRIPSESKSSCIKNKEVEVEEHPRNLLLSKNKNLMSFECNNIKLAIQNNKSKVVCATLLKFQKLQIKHKPKGKKPQKVGFKESLASPKPSKPRICLRWSPSGRMFNLKRKLIASTESECQSDSSKGDNPCTSNHQEPTSLGHKLFSIGQFYDSDLEVAFKRNICFVRNLGVDLLKGNRTTNLYTINLHDMASASLIFLMDRVTSIKSWLWHQCLSHLNFNTINDLAKNNLVTGLPKLKYHKAHLCPSCKQGKIKKASHAPKPIPNSKQRLHLLHMDLRGANEVESIINGEADQRLIAPEEIKTFSEKINNPFTSSSHFVRTHPRNYFAQSYNIPDDNWLSGEARFHLSKDLCFVRRFLSFFCNDD
ncbi:retrovirus-related pol polyprotein from transposon TNT 1-94 [Tanacetum coccineum]